MKITTVSFGLTKNLGNYESARLDITAEIQDGENWEETLEQLKVLVNDKIGGVKSFTPPKPKSEPVYIPTDEEYDAYEMAMSEHEF